MIHHVFELTAYGSNILTRRLGDVIGTDAPAGVGPARTPSIYLKDGERSASTYADVGTMTNPAVAASVAPAARQ